jgi:hypothetical protein
MERESSVTVVLVFPVDWEELYLGIRARVVVSGSSVESLATDVVSFVA